MAQQNQQSRNERRSVKYIQDPHKGPTIPLSDSDPIRAGNSSKASSISNTCIDQSDYKPDNDILTTGHVVYAIGQIWGYAAHPVSGNRSVENSDVRFGSSRSNGLINITSETDNSQDLIAGYPLQELQSKPDFSAFSVSDVDHRSQSPVGSAIKFASEFPEVKRFSGVQISNKLKYMYKWMTHSYPQRSNMGYHFCNSWLVNSNVMDCSVHTDPKSSSRSYANTEKTSVTVNMVSRTTDSNRAIVNQNTLVSSGSSRRILFTRNGTGFHKADCLVRAITAIEQSARVSRPPGSSPSGHHICCAAPAIYTFEECCGKFDDQLTGRQIHHGDKPDLCGLETNMSTSACGKSQTFPVKQQHAVAGAMAGICVSICLHPIDTVKTVVQSCHLGGKSFYDIGLSIVSERGLSGLYRGISSNIASSAPVSAVYTFTYETVKGVLLPLFPKEYCSIAHCTAGGCASVATSFIFTPSECIKQQMQVRSNYQNCWSALIGIIEKGGLASLYAGWGAVLCRNVPHSIIKFYTYEYLKRCMMPSIESSELDTLQTLACGGVAGSTAALFSTPFDVVKTRLQTQMPGFVHQYRGVFQAIQAIRKSEGFKGLYRGLGPRLIMYMTQGGLFFASYEFFKQTLLV